MESRLAPIIFFTILGLLATTVFSLVIISQNRTLHKELSKL
ncbi:hypothetical protein [Robertmurraya sp. Marseille-Q9965]